MKYLFLTVKKVGKKSPVKEDYEKYTQRLYSILDGTYNQCVKLVTETDKNFRLHMHCILHLENNFNYQKLKIYKRGWHIHWIEIESHNALEQVTRYLDKEEGFKEWLKELRNGENKFQEPLNVLPICLEGDINIVEDYIDSKSL